MSESCPKCGGPLVMVGDRVEAPGGRRGIVTNTTWPSKNMVYVQWEQPVGEWVVMPSLKRWADEQVCEDCGAAFKDRPRDANGVALYALALGRWVE